MAEIDKDIKCKLTLFDLCCTRVGKEHAEEDYES